MGGRDPPLDADHLPDIRFRATLYGGLTLRDDEHEAAMIVDGHLDSDLHAHTHASPCPTSPGAFPTRAS